MAGRRDGIEDQIRWIEEESRGWQNDLTTDDHTAIRRWQATDRFYEAVQKALTEPDAVPADAVEVAERLVGHVLTHPLERQYTAWRGVRSSVRTFGVAGQSLAAGGPSSVIRRFLAVSLDPRVVTGEFLTPELAGGAVLMRVTLAPGTYVGWLAVAGAAELRYQAEVLVHPAMRQRKVGVDRSGAVTTVDVEVTP